MVVTAHNDADADALRRCGADTVLLPFVDAAEAAVEAMLMVDTRT
ncbi:MAG: hypothetical protein ACK4N5_16510 [Myxococcales bacterium]